jgi:hypothetical protein
MLSLGIVALRDDGLQLFQCRGFMMNLRELDDCGWDPDTEMWWNDPARKEALTKTTEDQREPQEGMRDLMDWLTALALQEDKGHGVQFVFAAYPATFDFPFVRYYAQRFVRSRWTTFFGNVMERIACFDMGSYAMHLIGCGFHDVSGERMPKEWTSRSSYVNPCPHVSYNDADEQAHLLARMIESGRLVHAAHEAAKRRCPGCAKVARHPGEGYRCGLHP